MRVTDFQTLGCFTPVYLAPGPVGSPPTTVDPGAPMIYVAAFYTANPAFGMRAAMDAWAALLNLGYTPIVPHMSFFLDVVHPHPAEFWYSYDMAILDRCDAIYVCDDPLTDASYGVAEEVKWAEAQGIAVLRGLTEARHWIEVR
jgi:nucleoside 2-deoxyribosyltransferase